MAATASLPLDKARIQASLYGMLVGDALAMPGHWYYSPTKLRQEYGPDGITEMTTPHPVHVESMMGGSKFTYTGSIDILHDKAVYYTGHRILWANEDEIRQSESVASLKEANNADAAPVHYHVSLQAGQNTANACLARVLIRYLTKTQSPHHADNYQPLEYLQEFYQYVTTAPNNTDKSLDQVEFHNDAYLDNYLRGFFENASQGKYLLDCAMRQRDHWSIDALDAVVMCIPIIAAYAYEPEWYVMGRVVEHHMLTHQSVVVTATLYVLVPLLLELYRGADLREALDRAMVKMRPPKITGRQLLESYKANHGPNNIPAKKKWDQHMVLEEEETVKDLVHRLLSTENDEDVAGGFDRPNSRLATACYCEHAFAVVLYLAYKYGPEDPRKALIQNVNIGGHSTARGAVLGAILGAAHGGTAGATAIPFYGDLAAHDTVVKEIDALMATV
jgi:ADP-ribosylglycohydrolase